MIREWTRSTVSGFLMLVVSLGLYVTSGLGIYRAIQVKDAWTAACWALLIAATAVANCGLFV